MSRTPKAEISKLPIWAQKIIAEQVARIDFLECELEELNGHLDSLEWLSEKLAKDLTAMEDERSVETYEANDSTPGCIGCVSPACRLQS